MQRTYHTNTQTLIPTLKQLVTQRYYVINTLHMRDDTRLVSIRHDNPICLFLETAYSPR